jgi:hypothetical protein
VSESGFEEDITAELVTVLSGGSRNFIYRGHDFFLMNTKNKVKRKYN